MRIAICDDKAEERALIVKMTKKIFDDEKLEKIDISLSHCKEYAVAMVIGY